MTNKGWECRDVIETREVNLQDLRISPKLKWPSNISLQISRHPLTYPIDLPGLPERSQPTSRTRAYAKCQIGSIFGIPYYDPTCSMVLEYLATFTTQNDQVKLFTDGIMVAFLRSAVRRCNLWAHV